jgi:UDP-3-O-[3-hydroxymyristoyl] N-acetylglucosamine deacetylase
MLAALAGLGVYSGIVVEVSGPEMPLLDGGASVWCERIAELRLAPEKPKVQIARRAEFVSAGGSRYEFAPGPAVDVDVRLTLDDDRIAPCASWTGDRVDFRSRIAPARTFALAADLENLARLALVRHVERASVVVIAPDAVYCTGGFLPDEPARHKLLDLVGDMYLHGGPPLGRVHAERPGHTANAQALQWATAEGVFVPATNALLS